ncbi:hypothetical protein [Paenarthrobacter sp. JL.01a]|uniref:hypothetical protein n=1 Tax=Paenarthrobacter sp. JL.01a TaxID=2979324 RepID=UPI0021C5DCCA|nr:hypothetical protein [Paenarthrobacter sp. JL.01a]UXM90938.1 hypothetical protein N5P29_16805 [Paenarthrobacter sp. JL.01a]
MSKTDKTRPCKLKHAEGKPWWMPCCSWPSSHRLTKQRNRRVRFKVRAALHNGEEPPPYRLYPF